MNETDEKIGPLSCTYNGWIYILPLIQLNRILNSILRVRIRAHFTFPYLGAVVRAVE